MLGACDPPVRPFIEDMIHEADRRGVTVNWGYKGFSLRAPDRTGKLQSIFYCFPPGTNGSATAYVQGWMDKPLRNSELGREYARALLAIGGFHKAGPNAVRLNLTEDMLASGRQSLHRVWSTAESVKQWSEDDDADDQSA
jgi:hypothetical protein